MAEEKPEELEQLRGEVQQMKDRWVRARADYDNLQKRVARDAAAERDRNRARILEGVLPLREMCRLAERQAEPLQEDHPGLSEGLSMLVREFDRFLEAEGLVPVGAVGDAFDGSMHEAVASEPTTDVPAGHVARVIQPGYRLGEKVLRFAKVSVAQDPGGREQEPQQAT
jgi:molecular chaperone GrpE